MSRVHWAFLTSVSVASLVGFSSTARAQIASNPASPSGQTASNEVIVTAERRNERLQDVPLAVTAFTAHTLEATTTVNLTDLNGKIPNVILEAVPTFPNSSAFTIRGLHFADVESSFEPAIGVEIDGV